MSGSGTDNANALDDAALVGRVRGGDREAFAALVNRHFGLVVGLAEQMLGDRDDALDLSQEVFLTAYEQMADLERPEAFGAWLWRITRNGALMRIRRRRHMPAEVHLGAGTTVWEVTSRRARNKSPSAADEAERNDLSRRVREQLHALASDYQAVVRLYYLDGLDLRAIADRLRIPLGTVKWRLSQARDLLRKELLMSELSDDLRHRETTRPLLETKTIWGSGRAPSHAVETLLAQQILLCVRKRAMAPDEIGRQVKADVRYVREHLDRMTKAEVLLERDGRYRANCILFDTDDVETLKRTLGIRGRQTAEVIAGHGKVLSKAIAELTPWKQGFDEGYLRWLILPTMVLNFGVRKRLQETKGVVVKPPARADGGNWFYTPRVLEAPWPVEFGCNHSWDAHGGHAQYWNTEIGVTITRPSAADMAVVYRLAKGQIAVASLVDVFGEEAVASMTERGLARRERNTAVAAVPVFTPADGDVLQPVLDRIIDDVVDRVYAGYPDDVYAVLDSLGFSFIRSDYPAHAQELAQLGSVRALVEAGVLPEGPSPAPLGWGFFAWTGLFAPMARG